MTEWELYLFDLQGFVVVEQALSPREVTELNLSIEGQSNPIFGSESDNSWFRKDGLLDWGQPFRSLIDNPQITPYLSELLGQEFRLDHDYLHIIRRGKGPIGSYLHGGGTPYDPCQYYNYKNSQMYNGLTAVAYNLTDVDPVDGGFGCIPGSHKSNYLLPEGFRDLSFPAGCVQNIGGKAGSAIIFTEALTHGTLPWSGTQERRTLFYKYSPRSITWSRNYYNIDHYPDLTPAQKQILKSPGLYP